MCPKSLSLEPLQQGNPSDEEESGSSLILLMILFSLMLLLLIPLYRVDTFYTPGSKDEMTLVKFDKMKVAQIVN